MAELQNTIEIEFKPKGDDVLIATIQKLDKATRALVKAQSSLAGAGKKQVQSQNANQKAIKRLNIALALQGSNWKKAGISAKLYTKAVKGNSLALAQVRVATQKHLAGLTKTNKGLLDSAHSSRILGGSFAVLRSKMLITSFAIMLVEKTVVSLVSAFAKQEAVNQKLASGLANISGTTDGVTQRLIDYSSALQQTTAFGDEFITNGMAQLTTFGLSEKAITSLTPQVLNVARAIQTTSGGMPDLNSLFIAFGKATSTAVSALTRYGVVLTDTEKAQLTAMDANTRAVAIAEILDKQYGGLAESYAKTTMGMLESAKVARGDAGEAFGEVLAPAVLAVSKALKVLFEAMNPERIKAYSAGIGIGTVATLALATATGKLNLKLLQSRASLVKTGWGALVVVLGAVAGYLMDYFNVFDSGDSILSDHAKRLKEIKEQQEALSTAQQDGKKSLIEQLALLNARTETEKIMIRLGHEASEAEKILIDLIVQKKQALKEESNAKKQAGEDHKDAMANWAKEEKQRIKIQKDTVSATMEINKGNLMFQLEMIEVRMQQFRNLGFAEIDIAKWAEEQKTDIVIQHLEKRSSLYNSFMAGYDTFINSLTDMEMTGKERREKIWESTKAGFTKFLGELLKEKIKSMIAEAIVEKTASVGKVAVVAGEAKIMSALWASPAFASVLATGGTNIPVAIGQLQAGKIASQAVMAYAKGGDFVTNKPEMIMVGEAGREHVKITPVDRPENRALKDGGLTINVSAPLVDETILDTIIPAIEKAHRMNLA